MKKTIQKTVLASVMALGIASSASAGVVGFNQVSNNSSTTVAQQLFVDVSAYDVDTLRFDFSNNVGIASSITDVYFDADGVLVSPICPTCLFSSGSGTVNFSAPASPSNFGGGNSYGFTTTLDLSADADSGKPGVKENGVNLAGEILTILID